MKARRGSGRVLGADVWQGRWVVVVLCDGAFEQAVVAPALGPVLGRFADAIAVGVDMPVGLPPAGTRRPADLAARAYVGPRRSSVFPTPPAELLARASLADANRLATEHGWPRLSAQTWALRAKVLEVQALADADARLHEAHPEVSFTRAGGGGWLAWPKTSWNGVALRRRILADLGIDLPGDLGPPGAAGVADVLDAAAVAWSAARIAAGVAVAFPPGAPRIGAIWS